MFNHLQILLLLPLTRIYFPDEIIIIILGSKFVLSPFEYLQLKSIMNIQIPGLESISINSIFEEPQKDNILSEIGVESGSIIINGFSIFTSFIFAGIFHLFTFCVSSLLKRIN